MLVILDAVAEVETGIRRVWQRAGIARAKANGVYKGRKAGIDAARVREMAAQGMSAGAIARELGCHRQSVYRHITAFQNSVVRDRKGPFFGGKMR